MKKLIIVLFFAIAFASCKSTKDINKNEEDRQLTETSKVTTTRVGDTVSYVVPNIILRDTTITIKNYKTGTTQILKYNEEGKLTAAECISAFLTVVEENQKILIENINNMNKHKETEISGSIFIYFFIGLALFFTILFLVFFTVMKKYLKTIIPI